MIKRYLLLSLAFVATFLMLSSALSAAAAPNVAKINQVIHPAHPKSNIKTSGTLIIGNQEDFAGLNPFNPLDNSIWDSNYYGYFYDSLTAIPITNNGYMNWAATSITPNANYTSFTVTFATNITWIVPQAMMSNATAKQVAGQHLTAWDVFVSYQVGINSPNTNPSLLPLALNPNYTPVPASTISNLTNGTITTGTPAGILVADITMPNGPTGNVVTFHLNQPYAPFYYETLTEMLVPGKIWQNHMWSTNNSEMYGSANTWDGGKITVSGSEYFLADIGSGQFYQGGWTPNVGAIMYANPNYWMGSFQAHMNEVQYVLYGSTTSAVLALMSGEIDLVDWSVPPSYVSQLQSTPGIELTLQPSFGFFYMTFNLRRAPFNYMEFRHAVAHLVNKQFILSNILQGYGITGTNVVLPMSGAYYNASVNSQYPYTFNITQADKDLKSVPGMTLQHPGQAPGPNNYFEYNGTVLQIPILVPPASYDPIRATAAQYIQQWMQEAGLDAQAVPTDFNVIVADISTPPYNFDMYILGWVLGAPGGDPSSWMVSLFMSNQQPPIGSNYEGFANATFDQLLTESNSQMNPSVRQGEIKEAEGILAVQLPYILLYSSDDIDAYSVMHWTGWVASPSASPAVNNGWTFANLVPSNYKAPAASSTTVHLHASIKLDQNVNVYKGGSVGNVTVTVTGDNGVPVQGATVSMSANPLGLVFFGSKIGTTNSAGQFTTSFSIVNGIVQQVYGTYGTDQFNFSQLPPAATDKVTIQASATENSTSTATYVPTYASVALTVEGNTMILTHGALPTMKMNTTNILPYRVVDSSGKGVANASVVIWNLNPSAGNFPAGVAYMDLDTSGILLQQVHAISNSTGYLTLTNASGVVYPLSFIPGYLPELNVSISGLPANNTVWPGQTYSFSVSVTSNGNPVVAATVGMFSDQGLIPAPSGLTNANGIAKFEFTARNVMPGTLVNITATAYKGGYENMAINNSEVMVGNSAVPPYTLQVISLSPTAGLSSNLTVVVRAVNTATGKGEVGIPVTFQQVSPAVLDGFPGIVNPSAESAGYQYYDSSMFWNGTVRTNSITTNAAGYANISYSLSSATNTFMPTYQQVFYLWITGGAYGIMRQVNWVNYAGVSGTSPVPLEFFATAASGYNTLEYYNFVGSKGFVQPSGFPAASAYLSLAGGFEHYLPNVGNQFTDIPFSAGATSMPDNVVVSSTVTPTNNFYSVNWNQSIPISIHVTSGGKPVANTAVMLTLTQLTGRYQGNITVTAGTNVQYQPVEDSSNPITGTTVVDSNYELFVNTTSAGYVNITFNGSVFYKPVQNKKVYNMVPGGWPAFTPLIPNVEFYLTTTVFAGGANPISGFNSVAIEQQGTTIPYNQPMLNVHASSSVVVIGKSVNISAQILNQLGSPMANMPVSLSLAALNQSGYYLSPSANGISISTTSGTTNSTGYVEATVTTTSSTPANTSILVNATSTYNGMPLQSQQQYVLVISKVTVPLTATLAVSPTSVIVNGTVYFNVTASGGVAPYTYKYYFGNGGNITTSSDTTTYKYTKAGTYTAYVNVTDSAGTTIKTNTVTITVTTTAPPTTTTSSTSSNNNLIYAVVVIVIIIIIIIAVYMMMRKKGKSPTTPPPMATEQTQPTEQQAPPVQDQNQQQPPAM